MSTSDRPVSRTSVTELLVAIGKFPPFDDAVITQPRTSAGPFEWRSPDMGVAKVRARFAKLGGVADAAAWCTTHEAMLSSGSHRWIVLEVEGGEVVIGDLDRGRFAAYGRYSAAEPAAVALMNLLRRPTPAPLPRAGEELAAQHAACSSGSRPRRVTLLAGRRDA